MDRRFWSLWFAGRLRGVPPAGVAVAVTAVVMAAAVQPSLAAPTHVLQQSVASTPTLTPTLTNTAVPADASAPVCASCPPEIAADPLVAYSQQFSDAIDLWSQSPVTSVLCVVSGPT